MRFLLQAQFSATDEDIAAVRAKGYAAWLAEQFAQPIGTTGTDWLAQRGYGVANADTRYHNTSYPADYMLWSQLFTERDAVRKRVALALSEIMVVSTNGLNQPWPAFLAAGYWDVLNQHALGNFRALLEAVTLNPAMGVYLNALGSQKEDARTGRQPDENYAREVMQLFTLGLYRLNADGTEQRDASGNRIETYGPSDVSNLARVFTGYDYDRSQNQSFTVGTSTVPGPQQAGRPMVLVASRHSALAATFLGTTIGAGTPGDAALKTALDTLFNHPNVAPFIGRQLIQRLVTSNPSPAYVARVAAAFSDNGSGVRGDLRAVVAAILLDSEARDAAGLSSPSFGRLREPMVRFVQWGRTFGLRSARGSWKLGDLSDPASRLGQSPLRSPSVFNFFRPGYVPPSTAIASAGQVAPEFQIVTESSVGGYLNFMQNAIRNGLFVNAPDLPQNNASNGNNGFDITCDYAALLPLVTDPAALVRKAALLLSGARSPMPRRRASPMRWQPRRSRPRAARRPSSTAWPQPSSWSWPARPISCRSERPAPSPHRSPFHAVHRSRTTHAPRLPAPLGPARGHRRRAAHGAQPRRDGRGRRLRRAGLQGAGLRLPVRWLRLRQHRRAVRRHPLRAVRRHPRRRLRRHGRRHRASGARRWAPRCCSRPRRWQGACSTHCIRP